MAERAAGADHRVRYRQCHGGPARLGNLFAPMCRSTAMRSRGPIIGRVLRAVNERSVAPGALDHSCAADRYTVWTDSGASATRAAWWASSWGSTWPSSARKRWRCAISNCAVNRCHLQVEALMATPYASGLGHVSSTTRHSSGLPASISAVPRQPSPSSMMGIWSMPMRMAIGGQHLTLDIARQLSVSVADAERLKMLLWQRAAGPDGRARHDFRSCRSVQARDEAPEPDSRARR